MTFHRPHHQRILQVLQKFDALYLAEHSILFGGGTRIALEIEEYRESVDIDFFCVTPTSYRAVRNEVSEKSLGALLMPNESLSFFRDIRADRDGVRTSIAFPDGDPIKLEFVHFDYFDFHADSRSDLFPVPFIDRESCFLSKLLANADRYSNGDNKDIFDLCMMHRHWGAIPADVWTRADIKYGLKTVCRALERSLSLILSDPQAALKIAIDRLSINPDLAQKLVAEYAQSFLDEVISINSSTN
ncbi:nucleotidyl transferase AbiEii/AbiGii toxin family protein [Cellvibrio sp. OA-2007]|uniref:nucleotidyl transferase AbiEii/AbiGii toxin family protein n=1 Tax=Cellvibrio sp. OA-2007 TaxID=529823 RepID=UPI0007864663|nr:nucleotidyl transferase AbiEii/AbiGii toxin family protein [Cellvibrio sp. OA-2007]